MDDENKSGETASAGIPNDTTNILRQLGLASDGPDSAADTRAGGSSTNPLGGAAGLPGYEVLGELGRGGMGVVYKARQIKLNRVVALKMVLGGVGTTAKLRFLAEAEAVASVRHPHVVQVFAYGEHDGRPFLEFEYLPGGTLTERLKGGRLTPAAAAELVAKIARGVGAAHAAEVVHRDIKPGNVLFDADGNPKVTDFGLAKRGASELTNTVAYLGTAFYMPPEQAGGKAKFVGPPADVWALGVILYEAITGVRPFHGDDAHEVMMNVACDEPKPPRTVVADIPRDLETVCLTCLQKEPHRRYPNAQALAADLELFLAGRPVTARPVGPLARLARRVRRNPAWSALVIVVVAMGFGLLASLVSNYRAALQREQFEREAKDKANELAEQNRRLADEQTALRLKADDLRAAAKNELARADGVTDLLFSGFRSVDPLDLFGDGLGAPSWAKQEKEQNKPVKEFIREFGERFKDQLKDAPSELTRARLLDGYGNAMKNLGELATAEGALREALAIRSRRLPPTDPAVWKSELDLGRFEADIGHYQSAIGRFRKVYANQVLTPENSQAGLTARDLAESRLKTRLYEGTTLGLLGDNDAVPVLRKVTADHAELFGGTHPDTLLAKLALLGFMLDYGLTDEVVRLLPDLLATMKAQQDSRLRDLADVTGGLIASLTTARLGAALSPELANRNAAAAIRKGIADGEKTLPPSHFILAILRFELARILVELGDTAEADALYARILVDLRATTGYAQPKGLVFLQHYGLRLARSKRVAEARKLYDEFDAANVARFGEVNHWRAMLLLRRVELEAEYGDGSAAALPFARRAIEIARSDRFLATRHSAMALLDAGKPMSAVSEPADVRDAGKALLALTRSAALRVYGEKSREEGVMDLVEGRVAYRGGDRAAGATLLARAESVVSLLNPDDQNAVLYWRGKIEQDGGRPAEAEGYFRKAFQLSRASARRDPKSALSDAEELAGVLLEQGKAADAVPVLLEARRIAASLKDADARKAEALAQADALLVIARRTTDPAAAIEAARSLVKKHGASADAGVLAWAAWAVGLAPPGVEWDAAPLTAALGKSPSAFGYRGLALVHLRAKNWDGAGAALAKAGRSEPLDLVLRGLVAVGRGEVQAARAAITDAERRIEAAKPTPAAPFASAGTPWHDRAFTRILLDELRAAVGK